MISTTKSNYKKLEQDFVSSIAINLSKILHKFTPKINKDTTKFLVIVKYDCIIYKYYFSKTYFSFFGITGIIFLHGSSQKQRSYIIKNEKEEFGHFFGRKKKLKKLIEI